MSGKFRVCSENNTQEGHCGHELSNKHLYRRFAKSCGKQWTSHRSCARSRETLQ
jgi:hypothetical protein